MKHDFHITLFLLLLFLSSQVIGLSLLYKQANLESHPDGTVTVSYPDTVLGRPEMGEDFSLYYIMAAILVGTAINLLLIRFKLFSVIRVWFFLAVAGVLWVSFSVFMGETVALILACGFTALKLFRPNTYIHNLTELFMYSGLAYLIVPMFNLMGGILILVFISIYDAYSVWQSKHMITLAKAQAESKVFAGLMIPYRTRPVQKGKTTGIMVPMRSAILGGGDIAFPLIFSGIVMNWLIQKGIGPEVAFFQSLIVSFFSGIALFLLLLKGKKDRYYPAMPFISLGSFFGFLLILLF